MGKFGKYLRKSKIAEWADNYIDYKILKRKIKEIVSKVKEDDLNRSSMNVDENNDSFEINMNIPRETINISLETSRADLFTLYARDINGILLREFIEMLDKEFKKVYVFFVSMEKELYTQINSHLYIKNNIPTFTLQELKNELDSLTLTIFLAKSLKKFINDNTTALKKILKKFDKKLRKYFGYVSIKYLTSKLNVQNSDLEYMLQFKVIDETNTLIENLVEIIEKEVKKKNDKSDDLLIGEIKEKIAEIKTYIMIIDKKSEYQIKYKEWFYYIRQGDKIIKNNPQHLSNDVYNPLISSNMINDTLILKLLSERALYRLETRDAEMSRVNVINIIICFIHVALYMISYTMVIPSGFYYCKHLYTKHHTSVKLHKCFPLIWGLMPLFSMLSMIIFDFFSDSQYKASLILSISIMILGNFIYPFYSTSNPKLTVIPLILSRLLFGLGSNPLVSKKYITQFTTKSYLPAISLGYLAVKSISFALGPVLGVLLYFPFEDNEIKDKIIRFDQFSYHSWLLLAIYIIFLICVIIFFTSPTAVNFDINEESTKDEKEDKIDYGGIAKGLNYIEKQHGTKPLISTDEKKLINEIDDKLNEYNEKNEFSDTNKIPSNIKAIIKSQKNLCSYLGRAMTLAFIVFLFSRIVNESFILMLVLRMDKEEESYYIMNIIVLITCLFLEAIVSFLAARIISIKSRTRKLLVVLLFVNFVVSLCMVISSFFDNITFIYYILYYVVVLATSLCEIDASNLIANIMPPRWKFCKMEYGLLVSNSILLGRVIGCVVAYGYGKLLDINEKKGKKVIKGTILGIIPFIYLLLLIIVLINYKNLRIKAISRILRSHYLNKLN